VSVDGYLENIIAGLNTWITSDDFVLWKIEFVWQMREFKNNLFKHFDFEDDNGIFDNFPDGDSNNAKQGERIRTEHKQILGNLDKILTRLKKIKTGNDSELKAIELDIFDLVSDIRRHEKEEIKIVHSIYRRKDMDTLSH
jgi:hypothetical protein